MLYYIIDSRDVEERKKKERNKKERRKLNQESMKQNFFSAIKPSLGGIGIVGVVVLVDPGEIIDGGGPGRWDSTSWINS